MLVHCTTVVQQHTAAQWVHIQIQCSSWWKWFFLIILHHQVALLPASVLIWTEFECRSVMNLLTPEQQNRFEAFRRSSLARRNMKRVRPKPSLNPGVDELIRWTRSYTLQAAGLDLTSTVLQFTGSTCCNMCSEKWDEARVLYSAPSTETELAPSWFCSCSRPWQVRWSTWTWWLLCAASARCLWGSLSKLVRFLPSFGQQLI